MGHMSEFEDVIRTPRLELRPYTEDDRAFFLGLVTDPALTEHMDSPSTRADANALFERLLPPRDPAIAAFAIVGADGGACGHIALVKLAGDTPAELLFMVAADKQGQGCATEAARALIQRAAVAGISLVAATADSANHASNAVLEKLGFRRVREITDDPPAYWLYEWRQGQDASNSSS